MPSATPRRSLALTLALYLLSPLAMNAVIFGLGWATPHPANHLLPPGWAVGSIWMLLFAAMAVARWLVRASTTARWIDGLALLCFIYPLYTLGLSSDRIGLAGTIVTAIFTAAVLARLTQISRAAAAFTAPVLAWLLYAGFATAVGLTHS